MAKPPLTPSGWAEYQKFRAAFHAVLDPELYTPAWLDGEVATGRFILFTGDESAILCTVKQYPTGLKELQGELAVGTLREIASDLIPIAEKWALMRGCKSASIQSREGWGRVLKDYQFYQTTIRKAL